MNAFLDTVVPTESFLDSGFEGAAASTESSLAMPARSS